MSPQNPRSPRFDLKDGTAAFKNEDHLAAVLMSMDTDRSAWDKASLENAVRSVKEHVSGKLLFATFEIRKDSNVHLAEIYNHIVKVLFHTH